MGGVVYFNFVESEESWDDELYLPAGEARKEGRNMAKRSQQNDLGKALQNYCM